MVASAGIDPAVALDIGSSQFSFDCRPPYTNFSGKSPFLSATRGGDQIKMVSSRGGQSQDKTVPFSPSVLLLDNTIIADFQTIAAGGILILLVLLLSMNAMAIVIRNRSSRYK